MSFSNAAIEIRLGNVESRIIGPYPNAALDAVLNGSLGGHIPLVYDGVRGVFLTGALPTVKRTLREEGCRFRIRDLRSSPRPDPSWTLRHVELRDYQRDVVSEAVRRGRGLIDVGTGGGKTLLAAAVAARLGLPTLWLVTTRVLLDQTRRYLSDLFGFEPGVVGSGVRRPERLTVALIQSLDKGGADLDPWRHGTLVFDEGHHAAAGSYQDLIRRLEPRYQYFLSAVPFRTGSDQAVLDALAGMPLTGGKYSAGFLIENGYACPVDVRIEFCRMAGNMAEKPFSSIYREGIVENEERNGRIIALAAEKTAEGFSTLILTDRIEHGSILQAGLGSSCGFAHGGVSGPKLRSLTEDFASGRLKGLVATSALFQEGVSISGIHVLVAAGGMKSRARVIQTIGRGMRKAPGKKACLYVDFWDDDGAGVLRRHSRQRLHVLKEMGFNVVPPASSNLSGDGSDIPPMWTHAPGSRRFLKIDGRGRVIEEKDCYRPSLVPEKICRTCEMVHLCK